MIFFSILMISEAIQQNILLAPHTTLGIGGPAEHFIEAETQTDVVNAVRWAKERNLNITILGSGSNVLVSDDGVKGLVIRMGMRGVTYNEENGTTVLMTAGAGVILDELICELTKRGLWGLENLSGIPGTVGATPIQNVGAYGVEVSDVIHSVKVFDIETGDVHEFDNATCGFAYRHSFFKTEAGKRYIVLRVTFRLSRTPHPQCAYKDLAEQFAKTVNPSLADIRDSVLNIRSAKFPDWKMLGTAGSFFKNPIISYSTFELLQRKYPELPGYIEPSGMVKISLGWILDKVLGKKGYRMGKVGLYEKQALVLVNHGGATEQEVKIFSENIIREVMEKTGIAIEYEVTSVDCV